VGLDVGRLLEHFGHISKPFLVTLHRTQQTVFGGNVDLEHHRGRERRRQQVEKKLTKRGSNFRALANDSLVQEIGNCLQSPFVCGSNKSRTLLQNLGSAIFLQLCLLSYFYSVVKTAKELKPLFLTF
jgi:hypothetical protein